VVRFSTKSYFFNLSYIITHSYTKKIY
jgi:hypothetical protein